MKIEVYKKDTGRRVCCYQEGLTMAPDTGQLYQGSMNVTDRYSIKFKVDGIAEFTEESLIDCLGTLTEMRYFNEKHKMRKLCWNALNAISPPIAEMGALEGFDTVRKFIEGEIRPA